uniref:Granulins domain-containing protein n=1 Tax=Salmo trutta TaxID=8032 RepID=A0A674DCN8_SALTR
MWNIAALVLVVAGSASCYITCPDGKVCSDQSTCCLTKEGYTCCPVTLVSKQGSHEGNL